jgi:hypothetical protein
MNTKQMEGDVEVEVKDSNEQIAENDNTAKSCIVGQHLG